MTMLTFTDQQGRRLGQRLYGINEADGRRLVHDAAMLYALLQQAIGDDTLPKITRDLLLARALAQAEMHAQSMVIHFDDAQVNLRT